MKIIPLKWLCDTAVHEYAKHAPDVNVKYHFHGEPAETVNVKQAAPALMRQEVQVRILKALTENEITLRNAIGMQAVDPPDNIELIIARYSVSHADAVKVLELCGLGAEILGDARQAPEEIVQEGRARGLLDPEIVVLIDTEWTGTDRLPPWKIGALFPKKEDEEKPTLEQRGKRLRGKKT